MVLFKPLGPVLAPLLANAGKERRSQASTCTLQQVITDTAYGPYDWVTVILSKISGCDRDLVPHPDVRLGAPSRETSALRLSL